MTALKYIAGTSPTVPGDMLESLQTETLPTTAFTLTLPAYSLCGKNTAAG
jgi:hypothetical protein